MSHQAWGILALGVYAFHAIFFGMVSSHYEQKEARDDFERQIAVPFCFLIGIFWPLLFPVWLCMQSVTKEKYL